MLLVAFSAGSVVAAPVATVFGASVGTGLEN
jgi:hypothetical protein